MKDSISKKQKRFEKINNDPKFKPIPKKVHKVELNDNRFNAMFSNKDFYSTSKVDKYGKKIEKKENKNYMDEYYIKKQKKKDKKKEEEDKNKKEEEDKDKKEEEESESDTSEEFQEFLDNMNKQNIEEFQQEENEENIPMGKETSRIAIQNIDWTNIHALDLFVLLNSFCKGNQKVLKVEIYPSEYGIKEMAKENEEGPDKEIFNTKGIIKTNKEEEEEGEEEEEEEIDSSSNEGFDPVELRKYELKKLKYYYAVVYCDSVETANMLYNECDGLEIERTQSFMDMRFIPDELKEFPYKPKEVCDHMPANKEYVQEFKPNSALQDTKVKLTWDQNDPKREDLLYRAFHKEGFNEDDINELLVSSDSEEDSEVINELIGNENDNEDNKNIELNLLKKKRKVPKFKDGETIEIKFNKGFEGINPKVLNENENKKENKSKWEEFKEKKKNKRKEKKREEREKKKIRKENRKNNEEEDENNDKKADKNELNLLVDEQVKNMKKFKFNSKDERFQTNNNKDFAIDPTNKNYKKLKDKKIL